jgi:hypothetical protein
VWEQYAQLSPSILMCVQIASMNIGQGYQDEVVLPYWIRCYNLVSFSALSLGTPSSESWMKDLQPCLSPPQRNVKIIQFKNMPITVYFHIPPNLSFTVFIHHLMMYKLHSWKLMNQSSKIWEITFVRTRIFTAAGGKLKSTTTHGWLDFPRWLHPIAFM